MCPTHLLRSSNLVFACANVYVIFLINHSLHQSSSQVHLLISSLSLSHFPLLYFFNFLFYTDAGSLFFVLLMYLHHLTHQYWLASFFGIISLLFRQSNIVWMFFLASHSSLKIVLRQSEKFNKKNKQQQQLKEKNTNTSFFSFFSFFTLKFLLDTFLLIFSNFTGYIIAAISFVTFILINGSIALGDKSAHEVSFNGVQFIYFIFTTGFFAFPWLLVNVTSTLLVIGKNRLTFFLVFVTFWILWYTRPSPHPYLLADNRHYTFYLWRRLLHLQDPFAVTIFSSVASFGLFAIFNSINGKDGLWKCFFFICILFSVAPQRLLELRYFLVPFVLWRVNVKPASLPLLLELLLNLLLNFVTLGVFIYGARKDVRFMW